MNQLCLTLMALSVYFVQMEKESRDISFWQGKGHTQQELSKAKSKKFELAISLSLSPLSLSSPGDTHVKHN